MKSDTPIFNRSVCCICTKSICIKTSLYGWIVALNILMAFVGGVLILVGLVGNGTTEQLIVGIILHSFSLAIELLLSTYPSRYLLDMYGDNIQKTCCQKACCTFSEYSAKSYFLWGLYFILIIAASACCTSDNIEVTNRAFIAILIFFGSFTAVTYWSMVMTPTCAPTSEDLFYSEDRLTGFDASFNLGFMFLLSFVVTNVGFGVYFADEILHYVLISTGSASMIVSAGLEIIVLYRLRWNFPHTPSLIWGLAIFGYAGVSIVFFIYTMVVPRYNNLYLQGQFEQHVYYIVQAVPTFLGALGLIIWLIFLIVSSCTELIPTEIALAKTQVVVPVKEISNVISKDAPLIDDYDVKLYQTNDLV